MLLTGQDIVDISPGLGRSGRVQVNRYAGYLYLTCGTRDMKDRYLIGDLSPTLLEPLQDRLDILVINITGILSGQISQSCQPYYWHHVRTD